MIDDLEELYRTQRPQYCRAAATCYAWNVKWYGASQLVGTGRKWEGAENGSSLNGCRSERTVTIGAHGKGLPLRKGGIALAPQEAPSPANPRVRRT